MFILPSNDRLEQNEERGLHLRGDKILPACSPHRPWVLQSKNQCSFRGVELTFCERVSQRKPVLFIRRCPWKVYPSRQAPTHSETSACILSCWVRECSSPVLTHCLNPIYLKSKFFSCSCRHLQKTFNNSLDQLKSV